MRVEQLVTTAGKTRYMLLDAAGEPVRPVLQYLKFLDHKKIARNTLRTYCYQFKLFFDFLEQAHLDYLQVGIDDMGEFLGWLQRPVHPVSVHSGQEDASARAPTSINLAMSTVMRFYDFLMIHEDYSIQVSRRLKRELPGFRRAFKDRFYHLSRDQPVEVNLLELKVPHEKPKAVLKQTVQALIDTCQNQRDEFLLCLFWETGMRIGETLALWLEDIDVGERKVHIRDRGELSNAAEIKTVASPRTIDVSEDLINLYLNYVAQAHTEEVDTNHVFIKLMGTHRGQPLEYADVASLFRRLQRSAGTRVTPHMFRHGSFTALRSAGWKPEYIRQRAGHAYIHTTMQLYIHPSEEDLHQEWQEVEARMTLRRKRAREEL
jgi:integrase/recombinase XerD